MWATRPVTVPYATFGDPQSLNLYTYVENEPVNRVDADGHSCAGYSTTNIATGQSCEQLNPANTNAEQSSQTTLTEAQAQNQAQLNIQVIRSDNLSNSGQAAVNGQLGDMKADMAKIGIGVNITSDSTRSNIDLKNPGSFNKGAIPYFFVTSKEAGSSTSGSGFFGKKVGVVINEFANSGDKVVATHETLHILRGDIYAGKNGASWGRELHVRWETFKLEHGWTGGMGWLTDAARNPPNQ